MAATDFFTVEVLTLWGLMTYYVPFFIHLESRKICVAGVTRHPDQEWMEQMARNVTMEGSGFLNQKRYLLHDRDGKFCASFRDVLEAVGVRPVRGELVLMRRLAFGTAHDSVAANGRI